MKNPVKEGDKKNNRSLRGGSWYFYARYGRVSVRDGYRPSDRGGDYGFRLARTIKKSKK